jgi:hypothetical protein
MLSQKEIKHYTNLWCHEKGIYASDLEKHPQADDVVLLIKFREQLWLHMDRSEQGSWAALWSWTYTRGLALKKKHLEQLEKIGNSVAFKQAKQQQRQATIRAMRNRLQG